MHSNEPEIKLLHGLHVQYDATSNINRQIFTPEIARYLKVFHWFFTWLLIKTCMIIKVLLMPGIKTGKYDKLTLDRATVHL